MTQNTTILPLFPTYCCITKIDLTDDELNYFQSHRVASRPNLSNTSSIDRYILDNPPLSNLKNTILNFLNWSFNSIYQPADKNNKMRITQSWVNWTEKNQIHHLHNHPNSFMSGTLILSADINKDKTIFQSPLIPYCPFNIMTDSHNEFTSTEHSIPVETGTLIVFPSYLYHYVPTVQDDISRLSLAFNAFFDFNCVLGEDSKSHELKL